MHRPLKYFVVLLLLGLVSLSACSQKFKKAEKHLEAGEVDAALSIANELIIDSPGEEKHIHLLRRARLQWISQKLIDVRLFRLADNLGESERILDQIISNENDWKVFPTGATYATQNDEINYVAQRNLKLIQIALEKHEPLRALLIYSRRRVIFEDSLRQNMNPLKQQIKVSGQKLCQKLKQDVSTTTYYYSRFVKESCALWGASGSLINSKNSVQLFDDIQINFKIKNLEKDLERIFIRQSSSVFKQSIWFDEKSSLKLPINIAGGFSEQLQEYRAYRTHYYKVQVPYTRTEVRPKSSPNNTNPTSQSGFGSFFNTAASVASIFAPPTDRVIDNGNGTETVYTTHYREETRTYNFPVLEVTQLFNLSTTSNVLFKDSSLPFDFLASYRHSSDEHDENRPNMNLYPKKRELITSDLWLETQVRSYVDKLSQNLSQEWQNQFCLNEKFISSEKLPHPEKVLRCLYGLKSTAPAFVSNWFLKSLSISPEEWIEVKTSTAL